MSAKIQKVSDLSSPPQLAHLAQVDAGTGLVQNIIVIPASQGHRAHDYMAKDLKHRHKGLWIQFYPGDTSKPGLHSVGPGMTYVERLGGFIPKQPFPSWTLNESTFLWEAPIPRPGPVHMWNEETQSWYDPYTV